MEQRRKIIVGVLSAGLLGLLFILGRGRMASLQPSIPYEKEFSVFNTPCRLTLYHCTAEEGERVMKQLLLDMKRLHDMLNLFSADSEVSRLNARAFQEPVHCSDDLWKILLAARDGWRESGRAFDVTVGPLLDLWGFHARRSTWPSEEEIQAAMCKVGFENVTLDEQLHTVQFQRKDMKLDFGGIAKGYALGRAKELVERCGFHSFLIDFGGNICCSETVPDGRPCFRIGIRHPLEPNGIMGTVSLLNQCIATSGNYERYRVISGQRVGHLMDPRTGRPCEGRDGLVGVSVMVSDPTLSDVYSTTVFVGGRELALRLAAESEAKPNFILVYDRSTDGDHAVETEVIGAISFEKARF